MNSRMAFAHTGINPHRFSPNAVFQKCAELDARRHRRPIETFAFYSSSLQKQTKDGQNFLNNVKNDNLQTTNLQLFPSYPNTLFKFTFIPARTFDSNSISSSNTTIDYVSYISPTCMGIYNWTDPTSP